MSSLDSLNIFVTIILNSLPRVSYKLVSLGANVGLVSCFSCYLCFCIGSYSLIDHWLHFLSFLNSNHLSSSMGNICSVQERLVYSEVEMIISFVRLCTRAAMSIGQPPES